MLSFAAAFALALVGQGAIYVGIAFVNGALLSETLSGVYAATGQTARVAIMTLTASTACNFLLPHTYRLVSPGIALGVILVTLVLILAGKAVLLGGGQPNWRLALSVAVLAGSAAWVAQELDRLSA